MGIKVIAIEKGVYGHFREPGDEFEIASESLFSETWMERLDGKGAPTKRGAKKGEVTGTTGNNPIGAMPPNPAHDLA
jgi:hypothetical protein